MTTSRVHGAEGPRPFQACRQAAGCAAPSHSKRLTSRARRSAGGACHGDAGVQRGRASSTDGSRARSATDAGGASNEIPSPCGGTTAGSGISRGSSLAQRQRWHGSFSPEGSPQQHDASISSAASAAQQHSGLATRKASRQARMAEMRDTTAGSAFRRAHSQDASLAPRIKPAGGRHRGSLRKKDRAGNIEMRNPARLVFPSNGWDLIYRTP